MVLLGKARKGVSLVEVIIVGVLLSLLTVGVTYSLIPIISRTQAEYVEALLRSDLNDFQTALVRDFRNSLAVTGSGADSFCVATTYTNAPYIKYQFLPSDMGRNKIVRSHHSSSCSSTPLESVVMVRGMVGDYAPPTSNQQTGLNSFVFDIYFPSGLGQPERTQIYGWRRL